MPGHQVTKFKKAIASANPKLFQGVTSLQTCHQGIFLNKQCPRLKKHVLSCMPPGDPKNWLTKLGQSPLLTSFAMLRGLESRHSDVLLNLPKHLGRLITLDFGGTWLSLSLRDILHHASRLPKLRELIVPPIWNLGTGPNHTFWGMAEGFYRLMLVTMPWFNEQRCCEIVGKMFFERCKHLSTLRFRGPIHHSCVGRAVRSSNGDLLDMKWSEPDRACSYLAHFSAERFRNGRQGHQSALLVDRDRSHHLKAEEWRLQHSADYRTFLNMMGA